MSKSLFHPTGCSVLIPTARVAADLKESLESICLSLSKLNADKELVLSLDRQELPGDPFQQLAETYSFVRILAFERKLGGPGARQRAISRALFRTLIFTDDDIWVPETWASRMHTLIQERGIVTGLVQGRGNRLIDQCEGLIDLYRLQAKDSKGFAKFLSFPNFGIQRELLPDSPFDHRVEYNLGSLDLGNQLRLNGFNIFEEPSLVVQTLYPATMREAYARKIRHARGIAFVHTRMGDQAWKQLELGGHLEILLRWIKISLTAPMPFYKKLFFLSLNLCYVLPLIYFYYTEKRPERE